MAKPTSRSSSKSRLAERPDGFNAETPVSQDALPGPEEIAAATEPVRRLLTLPSFSRIRGFLRTLCERPPQVLLLEGGSVAERAAAAVYWALLLNCPSFRGTKEAAPGSNLLPGLPPAPDVTKTELPCLDCPECVRFITRLHRDCVWFDGTTGSIKIAEVRELLPLLGEPPREASNRIVVFQEAQALPEASANALLKSLEEPKPGTVFILTAPQRERLLPTLVSRSMVLTLPWPKGEDAAKRNELAPLEAALCRFLRTGDGLFQITGTKGSLDSAKALAVLGLFSRAAARVITARQSSNAAEEGLEADLAKLGPDKLRIFDEVLAEAQESLLYSVNPALVLEWTAGKLFLLLPRGAGM